MQAAFTPLLEALKVSADKLKSHLKPFLVSKAKAEAEERKRKAEEAARIEAEAKALEEQGGIAAEIEVDARRKEAEELAAAAALKSNVSVKSATGAGKTIALRTVKDVEVTNLMSLFLRYKNHPKVVDLLTSLATAEVRSNGFSGEIKGANIITREIAA